MVSLNEIRTIGACHPTNKFIVYSANDPTIPAYLGDPAIG
jgi:hypothetical protein